MNLFVNDSERENVQAWVKALKGPYRLKKTTHQLRRGDKFCCLGVACDISGTGEWNVDSPAPPRYGHVYGQLPLAVMEFFSVASDSGNYTDGSLSDFNDRMGYKSHLPTARLIERLWEKQFGYPLFEGAKGK